MSTSLTSEPRRETVYFRAINPDGDEPQIKPRCSFGTYLRSAAWGSHNTLDFAGNAWRGNKRRENVDVKDDETYATQFGSLYHSYILDPTHFKKTYIEIDDQAKAEMMERAREAALEGAPKEFSKRLGTYQDWKKTHDDADLTDEVKAALLDEAVQAKMPTEAPGSATTIYKTWCNEKRAMGLIPISGDSLEVIRAMALEIEAHEDARDILKKMGRSETSIFAPADITPEGFDKKARIWLKARLDWIPTKGDTIWDLKTCEDASEDAFGRACESYGYYYQLAFHALVCRAAGIQKESGGWIAQEKKWPYAVAVRPCDPERFLQATEQVKAVLFAIAKCEILGDYPKYATLPPTLPKWKQYELEKESEE